MRISAGAGLLVLGLLQMTGDALGLLPLKALALATAASPAPRVFSTIKGFEPYSTRFAIVWTDREGGAHTLPMTPELYARLKGPYNRRNAYGAAMAGGPVLAMDARLRPMFEAVARYGLCDPGSVLRELGVDPATVAKPVRVRYEPRSGGGLELPLTLEAPCR